MEMMSWNRAQKNVAHAAEQQLIEMNERWAYISMIRTEPNQDKKGARMVDLDTKYDVYQKWSRQKTQQQQQQQCCAALQRAY